MYFIDSTIFNDSASYGSVIDTWGLSILWLGQWQLGVKVESLGDTIFATIVTLEIMYICRVVYVLYWLDYF